MATSEEQLAQAVDEALEPAWSHERRRAIRRWNLSTVGRVAGGLLALWALGFLMDLTVGLVLPWIFFAFMGSMMTVLAFSQSEGREHLEKE